MEKVGFWGVELVETGEAFLKFLCVEHILGSGVVK